MNRILLRLTLAFFFAVGLILGILFLINKLYLLSILTAFILIISIVIFTNPKAYPFRFMYPGLLTFLFFMIIPMMFTIYIGFTNLSTGHFLSEQAVYDVLIQEKFIPVGGKSYQYKLIKNENDFEVVVQDENDLRQVFFSRFKLDSKEVILIPWDQNDVQTAFDNLKGMRPGTIFRLRKQLKNIVFVLPDQSRLKYLRASSMVVLQSRFRAIEDGRGLIELETGKRFLPDYEIGYFTDGEQNLVPGFYVNVGLKNFISLFTDDSIKTSFLKVLFWTLIWATLTVFFAFTMGLFLAIVVNNKNLKLKAVYRSLLIIPYSIPFFISVLVFKGMMNKDFGIINDMLAYVGLPKVAWLVHSFWAKVSCLLVNLWLGFPYMFLLITGILQSIPASVYEAASLDGAGRFATLRKITLPMIFSAIGPLLVGSFAFNLNNFVGIYLLTGGGPPIQGAVTPAGETDILISYTYRLAFEGGQGQHFGLASAISMLIFVLIAILTIINFKASGMMKEGQRA